MIKCAGCGKEFDDAYKAGQCDGSHERIPLELENRKIHNLKKALFTAEQRGKLYGENCFVFGPVMMALFPGGMPLESEHDYNRLGVLVQIVSKLTRYAEQMKNGGHRDSAHDIIVYAAILEELTFEDGVG